MDAVRLDAFAALLSQPDPADLPARGHRVTQPARPALRDWTLRCIHAAYLAERRGWHAEILGSGPRLRLMRTGTR